MINVTHYAIPGLYAAHLTSLKLKEMFIKHNCDCDDDEQEAEETEGQGGRDSCQVIMC